MEQPEGVLHLRDEARATDLRSSPSQLLQESAATEDAKGSNEQTLKLLNVERWVL